MAKTDWIRLRFRKSDSLGLSGVECIFVRDARVVESGRQPCRGARPIARNVQFRKVRSASDALSSVMEAMTRFNA